MRRYFVLCLLLAACGSLRAQSAPEVIRTWAVAWREIADPAGHRTTQPYLTWAEIEPPRDHVRYTAPNEITLVAALEENIRRARLDGDTAFLTRTLSENFASIDRDGRGYGKSQMIDATRTRRVTSLETRDARVTSPSGQTVVITGQQIETIGTVAERSWFTRVYVQAQAGEWRLLSSTEVRIG